MPRDRLKALNPVEYADLRQFAVQGIMPRLRTLGKFIQAGLIYPRTFTLCAGVLDEIAEQEREKKRRHVLTPAQMEQALRARKDSPIQ